MLGIFSKTLDRMIRATVALVDFHRLTAFVYVGALER